MSIASVLVKGSFVNVYDEKGHHLCCVALNGGSLQGYTSSTFSIKRGSFITIYDEKGRFLQTISG